MNKSEIVRRSFYIIVSLGGILYELLLSEEVRWPLLGGYGFIITVTVYSFFVQGTKHNEESL